ncbi:uncharacterized protein LOC106073115 [Biomphalaria glabrata]|uniref:Uncharacterized protein LOC106073115 n=1 Tax=Biomphalaria glabrata TaxID=6526 RepID=A0A9W2Z5R6_BIOGL|nr:uncharacterized protein LOC106073115 [Biomphalaria glabrata]
MRTVLLLMLLVAGGEQSKKIPTSVAGRVFALVSHILDKAKDGLTVSKLIENAKQVEALSKQLPGKVSKSEVKKLVNEISKEIGVNPAASLALEDKLTVDIKLINDYLRLWDKLVEVGRESQTSVPSEDRFVKVAAIGSISEIIQSLLKELDESVTSLKKIDSTNSELQNKEGIIIYEKGGDKDIGKMGSNTALERKKKCFCLLLCFSCNG